MGRLVGTAGSSLFIGPAKSFGSADFTIADFPKTGAGSIAWVEVGGTTNLGGAGDAAELITSAQIKNKRTRKMKGTRNAGSMAVVCDFDSADPGQLALIAAERTEESYAFKVVFNDAPAGGTPSERYCVGFVMSATETLGEANSVVKLEVTIEIDSNMVRVPAASA